LKKIIAKLVLAAVLFGVFSTTTFADEVTTTNVTDDITIVQPLSSDPGDGRPGQW